jgi:(E)-4-hydroxy-3-methylbut-2-enyl-diphosphate synthase
MINKNFFHLLRFPSHEVIIGDRPLGGHQPIRLQSMTNTNTLDIEATINQTIRIIEAGADYVRISAPNMAAAEALQKISKGVKDAGFSNPLIADIHFNADVALVAARHVAKVRINPGNYTGGISPGKTTFTPSDTDLEKEKILNRLKPLVQVCKEYGTAMRIGTNLGSLSPRIIFQYGNTPLGMVNATYEFLEIFRELDFNNLVISLKASKPLIMIEAYEKMVEKMLQNNMSFPLHIGITEAGEGENGRIKSALGICSLLNKGIGDTVRVSLTEDPEKEIPFAIKLSSVYQIPFTRNDTTHNYNLTPSDFYRDDIPVDVINHKAIVITDHCQENNPLAESAADCLEVDFIFTTDHELPLKNPKKKFLLPYNKWIHTKSHNTLPLADFDHIADLTAANQLFFLLVECHKEKSWNQLEKLKGLAGVIADFNQCDEVEINELIRISQLKKIPLIFHREFTTADPDELISHFAIFAGNHLLEKNIQGIWITSKNTDEQIKDISFGFLQSAGLRITRTEFISCPTCARTSYNLQKVLKNVQQHTSNIPGLKIAVMGCIVNGPGEMADADFGFVGTGTGKLHLYKGKQAVRKNIDPANAVDAILDLLKENGII